MDRCLFYRAFATPPIETRGRISDTRAEAAAGLLANTIKP
jgi:hypothetical protein